MKKSASFENRTRQAPRAAGTRPSAVPADKKAKQVKLSPARKQEPAGLLEEHTHGNGEIHAVRFEYFNPDAHEVLLAGSFNGWQPASSPMTRQRSGKWCTELLLPPGQYEYRLIVNGQWQDDPMAVRFVANPFGGLNCVIEVKPMATPAANPP